jgi:osmotically-inducible protein OsmY
MHAMKRVFQVLLSAIVLSVAFGCASHSSKESNKETTGEYVDDSWITSKVKAAFVKDKTLKASEINVETYKGKVQLSGFVADPGDVSHAGDVARSIKGVTSVKNDLHVK